ncbi:uncharacterized protein LOC115707936 [Cannabis sativa]|uniref:Uncharacterized protein n=1 Tax=Cannabis sativa TaxID=3483 RepID=A0A7J6HER2_CANSA|nr:uncharacterized protein LOC115707936 [Cannabis sativa]XP_030491903.2 uncharacterized protein LOC115707936 [Cannabis sativa]XP_060969842.1 uncharacterized protein LOC115707936 [Cannabis sativa]XP_060969848.1 uncharacterized protein LOC115707936 [Cannabis sativa]KAF4386704.1 hypothetical protein F8388_006659 [Cannabis sativa]KAF4392850.1 hypothetical protein G4B88_011845 [Cannabis sativa]
MTKEKFSPPNIVKSNSALTLAEQWVSKMTKAVDDEQNEVEGRHPRLGLGAKFSRQFNVGPLSDPIERKLFAKLDTRTKRTEESNLATKDELNDDSDDSEDTESRSQVFNKKRAATPMMPSVQTKKKKK